MAQLVVSMGRLSHLQEQSVVWVSTLQMAVAGLVMGALLVRGAIKLLSIKRPWAAFALRPRAARGGCSLWPSGMR